MNLAPPIPCPFTAPDWLQEYFVEARGKRWEPGFPPPAIPSDRPHSDQELICRAFEFAYSLHSEQCRASGEPYIAHPVAVAGLLKYLGGSGTMIAAGFLHDVVEDTGVTVAELEQRFGPEVSLMVDGVTKLGKLSFSSKTERQAENFRRMFLAMTKDIRVIVVKLADRLHNMRTLEHLLPEKQRSIARETLDIFAPLANRLGIGRFKWELEDLSFKYLDPENYRSVQELVAEKRGDREETLNIVAQRLRERLSKMGIQFVDISGRPKHLYGIYQKMRRQQKEFHEIYDVAAVRIIVSTHDECYRTLAAVHDLFTPMPGRFKDYIGLPKSNRYQSLHTVVIGSNNRPLEVQIRTLEMHHVAEYGIAAHWKYKEAGSVPVSANDEKFSWLRQLLDWQSDLKDAHEYLESIKEDLFEGDIYVFTKDGDVMSLPQGSTPVDFAYRVHTEVGHHCYGSRVNNRLVPLDTPLKNGDIVEILTQKSAHPSLDWINFVVTASARNRIRQWFKRSRREENIARGRELLEREMGKSGLESLLKSPAMQTTVERCNYHNVEDLLAGLGHGEVTLNLVVNRLREAVKAQQLNAPLTNELTIKPDGTVNLGRSLPTSHDTKSHIFGVEGISHHIAGCCHPVPGEPIIGAVTRTGNRSISIHRQGCQNLEQIPGDRLIPVSWNMHVAPNCRPMSYPIHVQMEVIDRVGILKDVLSCLSDQKINVRHAHVKTFPDQTATFDLGIDVQDYRQINHIFSQLRKMTDVLNLRRVSQVEEI